MQLSELISSCENYILKFCEQQKPYANDIYNMLMDFRHYLCPKKNLSETLKNDLIDVFKSILEPNDLIPDSLSIGLLDDYIVLKSIHNRVFFGLEAKHVIYMVDTFLSEDQIKYVIDTNEKEGIVASEYNLDIINSKLEKISDNIIRDVFGFIIETLLNILSNNSLDAKHKAIVEWTLNYVIIDEDYINDNSPYGLLDDYIFLVSVFNLVREKTYKSYQQSQYLDSIYDYDTFFGSFIYHEDGKLRFLNDYEKVLAVLAFREPQNPKARSYILNGPNDSFIKTLYLFFYQVGLVLLGFAEFDDEQLLDLVRKKERNILVPYDVTNSKTYNFTKTVLEVYEYHEEDEKSGFLWFMKKGRSSKNDRIGMSKENLLKRIHDTSDDLKLTFQGVSGATTISNEEQKAFIDLYLRNIAASFNNCPVTQINFISSNHRKICLVSNLNVLENEMSLVTVNGHTINNIFPSQLVEQDHTGNLIAHAQTVTNSAGYTVMQIVKNPGVLQQLKMQDYSNLVCDLSNQIFYNDLEFPETELNVVYFDSLSDLLFEEMRRYRPRLPYFYLPSFFKEKTDMGKGLIQTSRSGKYYCKTYYEQEIVTKYTDSNLDLTIENYRQQIAVFSQDEIVKLGKLEYFYNTITDFTSPKYHESLIDINTVITNHIEVFGNGVMNTTALGEIVQKRFDQVCQCMNEFAGDDNQKILVLATGESLEYLKERLNGQFSQKDITVASTGSLKNLDLYSLIIVTSLFTWRIYRTLFKNSKGRIVFIIAKANSEKHKKYTSYINNQVLKKEDDNFSEFSNGNSHTDTKTLESLRDSFLALRNSNPNNNPQDLFIYDNEMDRILKEYTLKAIKDKQVKGKDSNKGALINTVESMLCYLSDGSYRYIGAKQYIRVNIDDNQEQSKDLEKGDEIFLLGNQRTDDPLGLIMSKCHSIKEMFNSSQKWRNVLVNHSHDIVGSFHDKASYIQEELNKIGIQRELVTIYQWLNPECYRIAPQNAKMEIPLILKHFGSVEDKDSCSDCVKRALEFKSINSRIGGIIRDFLRTQLQSIEVGKICDELVRHLCTLQCLNGPLVNLNEDKELIKYLRHLTNSMEHLTVLEIYGKFEVPVCQLGTLIELIEE